MSMLAWRAAGWVLMRLLVIAVIAVPGYLGRPQHGGILLFLACVFLGMAAYRAAMRSARDMHATSDTWNVLCILGDVVMMVLLGAAGQFWPAAAWLCALAIMAVVRTSVVRPAAEDPPGFKITGHGVANDSALETWFGKD